MKICGNYFTHPWTMNSLNSKELIKNPSRRDNSWCKTGNNFRWFSVGGLTLMHEMTHLDGLSAHAGYPAVEYVLFLRGLYKKLASTGEKERLNLTFEIGIHKTDSPYMELRISMDGATMMR
jgi:hypothetical protein